MDNKLRVNIKQKPDDNPSIPIIPSNQFIDFVIKTIHIPAKRTPIIRN